MLTTLTISYLPDSYFKRVKIHLNFHGTKKLLTNIHKTIKVTKPGKYGQTSQPSRNNPTSSYRPDSQPGRRNRQATQQSGRGPRPTSKFCHIFRQGGHTTQECWYCNV